MATAGGGIALALASARLEWTTLEGFPDRPVELAVELPAGAGLERARLVMTINTPREELRYDLGEHPLEIGTTRLQATLTYPYEDIVPGVYTFNAELVGPGLRLATPAPASFHVQRRAWFA